MILPRSVKEVGVLSGSKLHHYVPRFLLRRFSPKPETKNPIVQCLEKTTGRVTIRGVGTEAAITHFNKLRNTDKLPPDFVEQVFALVEGRAADLTRVLVARKPLDPGERLELALFAHLQHGRTPRAREWSVYLREAMEKEILMVELANAEELRESYASMGEKVTLEDARIQGAELIEELRTGKLIVKAQHDQAVGAPFETAMEISPKIADEMTWRVMHAPSSEAFVIGDHPVVMHDPVPRPGRGVGWYSSDTVEVSLPLDLTACLVFTPGPPRVEHVDVGPDQVLEFNLRSYAGAQWAIYGPTQAAVQGVRAAAKRNKARVAQLAPVPPRFHILESVEGEDYLVATKIYEPPRRVRRRPRFGEPPDGATDVS